MSCIEVAQSLRDNLITVASDDDYYNDAQVKTRGFLEAIWSIPGIDQSKCEALQARYNLIHQDPTYTTIIGELTKAILSKQESTADQLNQLMQSYRV